MNKEIFKWHVMCTTGCKNADGVLELFIETEENVAPKVTCGPCGGKMISDITFVESHTVTE
jgi:hypothetical protein